MPFIWVTCLLEVGVVLSIGFDWSLHFKWDGLSGRRKALRVSPLSPIE